MPALYRVHDGPSEERLGSLRLFLGELGLQLGAGDKPTSADYQQLLGSIGERPDAQVIQTVMLRSLSQAVYSPEEAGHFGLGYSSYAHFTSPIRRYPDLIVHRAIKACIHADQPTKDVIAPDQVDAELAKYPYDYARMEKFGEHASMAERRADDATRDVMAWLKCEFLSDHVGEEYDGVIAAVVGFGFFVELADIYIEGLVHVSTLNGDYFQHDHAKHRLIGERTAISFRLGDEVRVKVMRVGMEDRKIDLELVSTPKRRQADRDALGVNRRGGRDGVKSDKGGKKDGKAKGERSKRGSKSDKPSAGRGSKSAGPKPGRAKPAAGSARDQLAADAARAAGGKAPASDGDASGGELRKRRPKS